MLLTGGAGGEGDRLDRVPSGSPYQYHVAPALAERDGRNPAVPPYLIKEVKVRELALAADARRHEGTPSYRTTRVSAKFYEKIEQDLRECIKRRVAQRPAVGKTIE